MKLLFLISILFVIIQNKHPHFRDYPVTSIFKGKSSKVIFGNNPNAKHFRTVIRDGVAKGVNFAGQYILVYWGCGTSCQEFVIVNSKNGLIYDPPGRKGMASYGFEYQVDSNLLIVDPIDSAMVKDFKGKIPDWLMTRYYLWNGIDLIEIDSSKTALTGY